MLLKTLLKPLTVASSFVLILLTVAISLIPSSILAVGNAVAEEQEMASVWNGISASAESAAREAYAAAYRSARGRADSAVAAEILSQGDDPDHVSIQAVPVILLDGAEAPSDMTVPVLTTCECMAVYGVVSGYADPSGTYSDPASLHWDTADDQDRESYPSFLEEMRGYVAGLYSAGNTRCSLTREIGEDGEIRYRGTVTAEILRHEITFMAGERRRAAERLAASEGIPAELAEEKLEEEISGSFAAMQALFSAGSARIGRSELFESVTHLPSYAAFCRPCPSFGPPFPWTDVTAWYGPRILRGKQNFHTGIDFGERRGTEVRPVAGGLVVFAYGGCLTDNDPSAGYGNYVIVYHGRREGKDLYTLYAHLHTVNVREGDTVTAESVIGQVGSRGNSTGPHLHWEVNTYDPATGEACAVDPKGFTV